MKEETIRKVVRNKYSKIARNGRSCCTPVSTCCGGANDARSISEKIGYSTRELDAAPEGANLGLGCGNPVALASLREGETVLDLGSGAGFDCFLAANKVGKNGRVIGVDMTPDMIDRARENAKKGNFENVEFRLGEIENLPVADNSVDIVISNCVINLSPDKGRVFRETYRVLKPNGRLMVSDIVLLKELPDIIRESVQAYVGCISGAMLRDDYLKAIRAAGFQDTRIVDETIFAIDTTAKAIMKESKLPSEKVRDAASSVLSVRVFARKPNQTA